jgi:HK97 family phage portal protein
MVDLESYIEEGFNINTLIYSAVMYKARQEILAPLRAYDNKNNKRIPLGEEHPLARLIKRPNPSQSWREFQMSQVISLNITGDRFTWFKRKNSEMGVPSEMYPLNPLRTYIVPGEKGKIKGYWYAPEGKGIADGYPLLAEDVSHVKFPNPGDPLDGDGYGMSPISPLARSGDVDNMVTHFLQIFFQSGVIPAGVLEFPNPIDETTAGTSRERWREIHGGYENWASEIAILDAGGKYQRVGMTFEEMGFEGLDERNESRVLGPFGVPPILIGSRLGLMRSTYANYKEAREACWEDTILPEMLLAEDDEQFYLRSDDGGYVARDLMKVPALRKDAQAMVQAWRGLVEYGVPKEQAAAIVGLEIGELPDGEVSYMPLNMGEIGEGLVTVDGKSVDGKSVDGKDVEKLERAVKNAPRNVETLGRGRGRGLIAMVKCGYCGLFYAEDQKFECPRCGGLRESKGKEIAGVMKCETCGGHYPKGKFSECPNCGAERRVRALVEIKEELKRANDLLEGTMDKDGAGPGSTAATHPTRNGRKKGG